MFTPFIDFYFAYPWLVWYLGAVNAFAFFMYGWDKMKAGVDARRISEKTLLILALIGGSLGALIGMKIFHHKTRKLSFQAWLAVILAAQILLIWYFFLRQPASLLTPPDSLL